MRKRYNKKEKNFYISNEGMVVSDDNSGLLWENSLADQLQDWAQEQSDYPSYDQNRTDSWRTMLFSDVEKPEDQNATQNVMQEVPLQDSNAAQAPVNSISDDAVDSEWEAIQPQAQAQWPMRITEEALEEANKQQEQEAQAAAAAAMAELQEDPEVSTEQTPEAVLDEALSEPSFEEGNNVLDDSKETLGGFRFNDEPYKVKRYNTWFLIFSLGIILFWWISYVLYVFYQYLTLKSEPTAYDNTQVDTLAEYYDDYGQKIWLFNNEPFENIDLTQGNGQVDTLLRDPGLNFVQKREDLQFALTKLWDQIIWIRNETKLLREKMNRDGFFPQELVDILNTDNAVSSIQRSLNSLEVVKFSSAIRVFSLMDDIVKDLADSFNYTKSDIKKRLNDLMERWETDVELYLNDCYNNPYEPEDCSKINDFDMYYKKIKEDKNFDTVFFKNLMKFINNQLEYNNMPSFSITFNSFDWQSNSISFSVEVNTTIEDETALIQQGVKSPHIFIISELIKLLKQSTFIVGKAIDAKDIKVVSKPITVAGRQFNVNNSVNTFTLPIQKTTEREIFDFIDTYTTTVQTGSSVSDMISSLLNDSGNSVQEEEKDESVVEEDSSNEEGGEVIEE